jgi:hypothetical protein
MPAVGAPDPVTTEGADAVAVDRVGAQRRDRVLVEVAGHHDAGAGGPQGVELGADLAGQHTEIAGVDADRAQPGAGDGDRIGHPGGDVVGVDQQSRADAQRVDLGAERRALPAVGVRRVRTGVQHGERVRAGAQCGHAVGPLGLRLEVPAKPAM